MNNSITERIVDFLKDYKPFNFLSYSDLFAVASSVRVSNIEKNKSIFKIDDTLHDCFYVVVSGSINLSVISDAEESSLNICHSGDIFGLRPFFAKNNYMMTAKSRQESIVYAIPIQNFKPLLTKNEAVLDFLLESFASTSYVSKESAIHRLSNGSNLVGNHTDIQYFQSLDYNKNPLIVKPTASIKDVAFLMTNNISDYAIVAQNELAIGIVSNNEFKSKIATGRYSNEELISKIMLTPVITVHENLSLAESQFLMLLNNTSYLCVTEDGSIGSKIKGIISENDLIGAQANNPGILLKEIKKSFSNKELKNIREKLSELIQATLTKNIPLHHISMIAGEVVFGIIRRAIELAILELGSPPARFAWINAGSQGRKEQILYTDHDSYLIFENVTPENHKTVKEYFLKLAQKVTASIEFLGYELCTLGHTANNAIWCKSIQDWSTQLKSWINMPGENTNEIVTAFFDYDLVYGDLEIEQNLTSIIYESVKNNSLFYDYLGNEALKKPTPFNFFKKLNLEEEGEFKGLFDIKNRGLIPLIDAARLLILSQGIKGINNTYLRYKQLAIIDAINEEIYLNCAEAFLILSKFSVIEGLKNDSKGQYIDINEISKSDREKLKNAFLPFKELEELIKDKFQLTNFS
jgi:CBS domain-containing protein